MQRQILKSEKSEEGKLCTGHSFGSCLVSCSPSPSCSWSFGVLFMRDVYLSMGSASGEVPFTSLLFGIILLLVGGGLLCSTIAETVKKLMAK